MLPRMKQYHGQGTRRESSKLNELFVDDFGGWTTSHSETSQGENGYLHGDTRLWLRRIAHSKQTGDSKTITRSIATALNMPT